MTFQTFKIIFVFFVLTTALTSFANAEEETAMPQIWGQWATVGYSAVVDIYPCEGV